MGAGLTLLPQAHPPDEEEHSGGRETSSTFVPSWRAGQLEAEGLAECTGWKQSRGSLWLQCKEAAECLGGEPHPHRLGV